MTASRTSARCLSALSALVSLVVALVWVGNSAEAAQHTVHQGRRAGWAPAATATIHPGTQMLTGDEQCTANFVFTDAVGNVYVGYAAHCAGTGGQSDTNGCTTGSVALNSPVTFLNGMDPISEGDAAGTGRLVYSSWITMHKLHTRDADTCAYNDFALVRVDPGSVATVNPSVPQWGGPVALAATRPGDGASIFTWGQSGLRPTTALSGKRGVVLGNPSDWSSTAYTASPGIPGDSGSGFLDASGRAFGVLSTIALTPIPGSNGVGNLAKELAFAKANAGIKGLALTAGTEPFTG